MKIPAIQWYRTYWGGSCSQKSFDIPCSSCSTILQILCCHLMWSHGLYLHKVLLCQILLRHLASSKLSVQTVFLISLFLLHFHCFSLDVSRVLSPMCSKMSRVFKVVQTVSRKCFHSASKVFRVYKVAQTSSQLLHHRKLQQWYPAGFPLIFKMLVLQKHFYSINFKIVEIQLIPKLLLSLMWMSDFPQIS